MALANNNFSKGIHTDNHNLFQPDDTYRYAQNFNRELSGALTNEQGSALITALPNSLQVLGSAILNTRVILFLCSSDSTQNEIGYFDTVSNTYTTVINSNVLGFSINHQVDAIARVNFLHQSVVYFVDNLNPPRVVNIDNPPSPADYKDQSQLLRNVQIPYIDSNISFSAGGTINDGTYQFAVRYADANGNTTPFGFWSKPIPVVDKFQSVGRMAYIGGPLTTIAPKSLNLTIDNLDPNFPFIDLAVYYLDSSAQANYKIVGRYGVNGSTLQVTFSSMPTTANVDISAQDATLEFPDIATAKCIEQKDKRCYISNISTTPEGNFQEIANNIAVSYFITEVDFYNDNGFTSNRYFDYKSEQVSFTMKGYQRDEVYSLGFGVVFKNGTQSFVYHIPGVLGTGSNNTTGKPLDNPTTYNRIWVDPTVDTPTTGQCGCYVSTETYPQGQGYPTDGIFVPGTPNLYLVRHHKMPNLQQQPHFGPGNGVTGSDNVIRIMGLKFTLNSTAQAILAQYASEIQGIVFYRQPRNVPQNRGVYGQGFVKNLFQTYNQYNYGDGSPVTTNGTIYKKEPWAGNYSIDTAVVSITGVVGTADRKIAAWYPVTYNGSIDAHQSFDSDSYPTTNYLVDRDKLAFFSPEVYLDPYQLGSFSPSLSGSSPSITLSTGVLKTVMRLVSNQQAVGYKPSQLDSSARPSVTPQYGTRMWMFNDYNSSTSMSSGEFQAYVLDLNKSNYYATSGSVINIQEPVALDNSTTGDFLYLKLSAAITVDGVTTTTSASSGYVKPTGASKVQLQWSITPPGLENANNSVANDTVNIPANDTQYLCALYNPINNQYGSVGNQVYNIIAFNTDFTLSSYSVYGGDTFIAKYAFSDKDVFYYRSLYVTYTLGVATTNWEGPQSAWTADAAQEIGAWSSKALYYYFAETMLNPNYQFGSYFPNASPTSSFNDNALSELSTRPYTTPNNQSYNKTYSSDNEISPGVSKTETFQGTSNFETRTYYSEQSVEGEQQDGYTQFLVNNYDDLPKNTGAIQDSFILNNDLYLHTPQALWQTFVNPRTSMLDSAGEVIVGTGGIFSTPPRQLFTINGGYCGTTSQFAGCNTPYGRIFLDNIQGKVFLIGNDGAGIEEISAHGMYKDFVNLVTNVPDNPSAGSGYISAFDYKHRRWILSSPNNFTISYHPELKSWSSYHTYLPNFITSYGNRTLMFRNGTYSLHELNIGPRGVYFGDAPAESIVKFVVDKGRMIPLTIQDTKVYDNLEFHTISINQSGVTQLFDTFSNLRCTNEYQDTGNYSIITTNTNFADEGLTTGQILARLKNNQFQTFIPRALPAVGDDPTMGSRLKSKYLFIELSYNNTPNNTLTVSFVNTKIRRVYR